MPELISHPPITPVEPVTDILHGVAVVDPYRWLEEHDSPRTRRWLESQTGYARSYLDNIAGRAQVRERVRQFLTVENYDSVQKIGETYYFRKRLPHQEQPCIYKRQGVDGQDELLIDPAAQGSGKYTAVKLLRVSPDGKFILYEIKKGGERTGTFAILEIVTQRTRPDVLPKGYLRGFAFAPDGNSFFYIYEAAAEPRPLYRAAYSHVLGTRFADDEEVFRTGEGDDFRLSLTASSSRLGFLVYRMLEKTLTSFYVKSLDAQMACQCVVYEAEFAFRPLFVRNRIFAITDRNAPNLRIVEIRCTKDGGFEWAEIVPEKESRIHQWIVTKNSVFVSYARRGAIEIFCFDFNGTKLGEWAAPDQGTIRFVSATTDSNEVIIESETFAHPVSTWQVSPSHKGMTLWNRGKAPFRPNEYEFRRLSYTSKDGTQVPIFLFGKSSVLNGGCCAAIMTSYGGFGVSVTPQFSVFVALLVERGFLFALPNIRGGSEFGATWHQAAKRRGRQNAFDDFVAAAEWLITTGRAAPDRLAIFGGSNSGLLVAAALTQRPELFRAAICLAPLLDMLRYHLFDDAAAWRDEFGTADDPEDFAALIRYSPYQRVSNDVSYPATMFVSGDADGSCNPLHARKMTARLQAATSSGRPVLLSYSDMRGHSPVLPLSDRIEALTDRIAFLCDQLTV